MYMSDNAIWEKSLCHAWMWYVCNLRTQVRGRKIELSAILGRNGRHASRNHKLNQTNDLTM